MGKKIDFYADKQPIAGQHCKKCALARFTANGKENYCLQTKRFGKPNRGKYCKHFKKIEYQKESKSFK